MKKCSNSETIERKNGEFCSVTEFPIDDNEMNFATSVISGRYPEQGRATNTVCKEMVYIASGSGEIVVDGVRHPLSAGDAILILPKEQFYWDGNMTLHIACTPAFYPEQHLHIT